VRGCEESSESVYDAPPARWPAEFRPFVHFRALFGQNSARLYTNTGRTLTRRLALIVVVTALALLPSPTSMVLAATKPLASAQAGAPPATSSFYLYASYIDVCGLSATTECPLYDDAANQVVPPTGGMTILDFGAPCFEPATLAWGTQMFSSQSCTPDGTLVMLAQAWLRGFVSNPDRPASTSYILAAGTSNSLTAAVPGYALSPAQMALHGRAWFTDVVEPIASAARALSTSVVVWAGNDIEQSSSGDWYDGPTTGAWVDGYAAASGASKPCTAARPALMVNYGDYVPNEPGWSEGAVYHVSWQSAPACPLPEIYQAVNANEWQSLNGYAASAGLGAIQFLGVLSQDGAGGSLTSLASWNALRNATGQPAPYLSVIGVTGPTAAEVPDPPTAVTVLPGPNVATVSWQAPAWDGGAGITGYTVTAYSAAAVPHVATVSGWPAAESVIVDGLVNGASYTFYVSATNRIGTGPQSLPSGAFSLGALLRQ
jgi:hypothetical protein